MPGLQKQWLYNDQKPLIKTTRTKKDCFIKYKFMPSNKQYHKDYYERNKAKRKAAVKKWREENPEKYKEYNKEYQSNIPYEKRKAYEDQSFRNKFQIKTKGQEESRDFAKKLK